tara:strand:+ start:125 stop:952 length:828 start_codon:yes stop_codon:yes gene_type:complete
LLSRIISKLYRIIRYSRNKLIISTASSDDGLYPDFCLKAAKNESYFKNFKRNIIYTQVLEHVSEKDGLKYQKEIDKLLQKESLQKYNQKLFSLAALNDSIGNPKKFFFQGRALSPTSLRYIKVALEIIDLIQGKKINSIVEIGGGYGGQALLLSPLLKKEGIYTIFDLEEVTKLIAKFASMTFIDNRISLKNKIDIEKEYDLFISNYALSELTKTHANQYLKKVLSKSRHGYITYNNPGDNDSLEIHDITEHINYEYSIIDECPLMSNGGVIIKW